MNSFASMSAYYVRACEAPSAWCFLELDYLILADIIF